MKIAQLAPPWLPVPPPGYGGTERVVYDLTEELVHRGHDVTLFASGDSHTSAHLSPIFPTALGNSGELKAKPLLPLLAASSCFERAKEFDVIHSHVQYIGMFFTEYVDTPVVHTIHGSIYKKDMPEEKAHTLQKFKNQNFISISNAQRKGHPDVNFVATVYNSVILAEFPFNPEPGKYLCWLGRITEKKGLVEAIETAKRLGLHLKIAGVVDPIDKPYFDLHIRPLLSTADVEFRGSIATEKEKSEFLAGALALLFPISWQEPFGIVMVEAMATGTPVVAFARGSVPEVVSDGETGFIINPSSANKQGVWKISETGIDGLCAAVDKISGLSHEAHRDMRKVCRHHVEKHFTVEHMADGYESVYRGVIHP